MKIVKDHVVRKLAKKVIIRKVVMLVQEGRSLEIHSNGNRQLMRCADEATATALRAHLWAHRR